MADLLSRLQKHFEAIEAGKIDVAMACFAPDVLQIEHPNGLKPQGDRRGLAELRKDAERGSKLLAWQRFMIRSAVCQDDRVALQVDWSGAIAGASDIMHVRSAMFFRFKNGLIVEQENYDLLVPSAPSGTREQ
jgi:ketosteroid isomerase-like protein